MRGPERRVTIFRRSRHDVPRTARGLVPSPAALADVEARVRSMVTELGDLGDAGSDPPWRAYVDGTVAQWHGAVRAGCRCADPEHRPVPVAPRPARPAASWTAWLLVGVSFVGDIAVLYTAVAVAADSAPGTTAIMVLALAAAGLGLSTEAGRRLRHPVRTAADRTVLAVLIGLWGAIGLVAGGIRLVAPITEGGDGFAVDALLTGVLLVLYLASGVLAAAAAYRAHDPAAGPPDPGRTRAARRERRHQERCLAATRFCDAEGLKLYAVARQAMTPHVGSTAGPDRHGRACPYELPRRTS